MLVKMIRDEDYSSYKEVSMLIAFPHCNFKCCTDLGRSTAMCQNSPIARLPTIEMYVGDVYDRYQKNVITHSIVCGGLEPLDSLADLITLVCTFRHENCNDPFVIYTGYTEEEASAKITCLSTWPNIIMKFGRYIPAQPSHYDPLLGVVLASPNQYAKKIS